MGFTTKNADTKRVTYVERKDVNQAVEKFQQAEGWDLSDIRNRALMWYLHKWESGELDDPKVSSDAEESLKEIEGGSKLRDLL